MSAPKSVSQTQRLTRPTAGGDALIENRPTAGGDGLIEKRPPGVLFYKNGLHFVSFRMKPQCFHEV